MAETPRTDIWADWLLHGRHADDPAYAAQVRADVMKYVDHLLDRARLGPGMTLLDVGSGEGAVAFRAIERVGSDLKVVLTDISRVLLTVAQAEASRREVEGQCRFIECGADNLRQISEASVDIVANCAVLAYVAGKQAAIREFRRVLKPVGGPHRELLRLIHRWKSAQFPDTPAAITARPITNFTERTLWNVVRSCGLTQMNMELHVNMGPAPITSWDLFLGLSPHPLASTLGQISPSNFPLRNG